MSAKRSSVLGLDAFVKQEDIDEFVNNLRALITFEGKVWDPDFKLSKALSKKEETRKKLLLVVLAMLPLTFFFSSFIVLVPLVHGVIGHVLHKNEGWEFYQPGKGGVRFVALNGMGWTFYAATICIQLAHIALGDFFLVLSAFISGLLSLSFIFSSLFAFQGSKPREAGKAAGSKEPKGMKKPIDMFNSRLQRSVLMHTGENPSGLWWVLITLQLSLSFMATWFMALLASESFGSSSFSGLPGPVQRLFQISTLIIASCCYATAVPVTHAIGGKWKNFRSNFTVYQPFTGGKVFVGLQAVGWFLYGLCLLLTASSMASVMANNINGGLIMATAFSGFVSELMIAASLFYFEDHSDGPSGQNIDSDVIVKSVIDTVNHFFGPGGDWAEKTRKTTLTDREDWRKGEDNFQTILKDTGSAEATGESYLIVGCGFVGKRLVKRLLERGESKIKIFDLNPNNPFTHISEIEYIIGDVTKIEQIQKAMEGVDVVYATFALIRFMDRLPHQAAISYHVNVRGTEVLFDALKAHADTRSDPVKVIVTSSSHATTDETSLPRKNRDESAPYVERETAHNHYGWTKAEAEKYALTQNSDKVVMTVIRPCSGVFGGDDRTSVEKCVDLGVVPGIGAYCEMDWVYVENVVLGHILAETGLRKELAGEVKKGVVSGQPFNISNNDATSWIDFWFLVKSTLDLQFGSDPKKKTIKIEFCFVPMDLLWGVAFCSELVQKIFKGKVSLGADLDSMTPAMLSTATMNYTYGSAKAKEFLGYEPAYSLDEGVQKACEEYYAIKVDKKAI